MGSNEPLLHYVLLGSFELKTIFLQCMIRNLAVSIAASVD
jgi:hypothetical protein